MNRTKTLLWLVEQANRVVRELRAEGYEVRLGVDEDAFKVWRVQETVTLR